MAKKISFTSLVNTYWNHPVSNVSKLWHLHGPKNCYIYVAAKKEYRKNLLFRGRISSVGGALAFRTGWRRFDSGDRDNTHGLTQTARPSRGLNDHASKIVVPSPVGEVKIVSSTGTFMLNTLALEQSAFSVEYGSLYLVKDLKRRMEPLETLPHSKFAYFIYLPSNHGKRFVTWKIWAAG